MRVYYFSDTGKIHAVTEVLQDFDPGIGANIAYLDTDVTMAELPNYTIEDGTLVLETDVSTEYRNTVSRGVNTVIGRARTLFITDVPGQQMTYIAKQNEAKELLAMPSEPADPSVFPFLFAELGITGQTVTEVAQVTLNLAHQWGFIGSSLEKLRVGTNYRIAAVATRAELLTIQTAFLTDLSALLTATGHTIGEVAPNDN